ncbi:MAG: lysyl-tRNA synthetase [Chlamydiota bacterium]|jgi:lysyl-tRNA synthetase class 2
MTVHTPEYHKIDEFQNRTKTLADIRALGIDPYPPKYVSTEKAAQIALDAEGKEIGDSAAAEAKQTRHLFVSGRLVLMRPMGKNAFAHIADETGRIQVMFNRDHSKVKGLPAEESAIKFIEKKIDLGDIIGIEGFLFRTHKGEVTIYATEMTLLAKALLPLPDKHGGLADLGVRYRKRWLDLITDEASMARFRTRSRILFAIRRSMEKSGFEEVETPILQNIYGGAQARPFTTHLHAHHQDMYLRIALEISLKKLIVGGMQRIFEIGKVFRNEGIDKTHNPEFTMLEAYAAGWDYYDMMDFTETLFEEIALDLFGTTEVRFAPQGSSDAIVINVKAPWKRLTMKEAIKLYAKMDVDTMSEEAMRSKLLKDSSIDPKSVHGAPRGLLIAQLFGEFAESHLIEPHHIIDHPIETTPLCKLHREPKARQQGLVERFESFILGREICNSYSELNDPELQRALLVEQAQKRDKGDEEASPLDEEFLEAVAQGMPPTGGVGIGIDRLVMLFTGAESIRDVLFFPIMRPEETNPS